MSHSNQTNNHTEFYYHFFKNILIIASPLLIISAIILSLPHSSAIYGGVSSDKLILSLPSSCTLSNVVNTPHSATLISGTYTPNIGKTTITTLCNDGNGYAVYANGISGGTEGRNVLISNISNEHDISTGTAISGNISNWAMKLGSVTNDGSLTPPTIDESHNNIYGLVPSSWTKVVYRNSGTTDMVKGSSFTTTYSVYTAPTQHAGAYIGQVAYVLIHAYGDDAPPSNIRFMQDVADWEDELEEDMAAIAVDRRDYKPYYVTKLKDGHIWMTQNLDFDIVANGALDSTTTDLNAIYNSTTGEYAEYNDGYTVKNGIIYWRPANTTIDFKNTTITGWVENNTAPYSANKIDDTETGHTSLGNHYNWTAAIASNDSSSLTQSTLNDVTKNPKNSICPKGWRLPTISSDNASTIGSTNEFARLNYLYNNNSANTDSGLTKTPLWFSRRGVIYSSLVELNNGFYQSSTINSAPYAYYLFFNNTRVGTSESWVKSSGRNIRCIAR